MIAPPRAIVKGFGRGVRCRGEGIANEILMTLRSCKKLQNEVSLQDSIGSDKEGNEIMLIDVIEVKDDDPLDKMELCRLVKELYCSMKKTLKDRENLVLQLRYGLFGRRIKTQREIAQKLGISRSYVSRIEKRAIEKLSTCLEK